MTGMTEAENKTQETRAFFDRCADTWDARCRHDPRKIAAIVTLAGVKPGCHVADLACGTGALFREILSRGPEFLLGVDLSEKMIAKARSKCSDPRLRLLASDVFDISVGGFDCLLLYSAYPHFPDKKRLAAQMASMLKTGGRFLVAHSESRAAINGCHRGEQISPISWKLHSAREEAENFSGLFAIDMLADTEDIYFFSGTKKQPAAGKINI